MNVHMISTGALRGRQESAANRESQLEEKRKHKEEGAKLKAKQRAEVNKLHACMQGYVVQYVIQIHSYNYI